MAKTKCSEDEKDLHRVINNAFDFLETAIKQFEKEPKYSVINFCSGIELILKARLMIEHWSLIVDEKPNLQRFKDGAAKTINFTELIPRIMDVTNDKIGPNVKICFKSLANHRNRMIHFYHKAQINKKEFENEKTTIAIEQATAWYCLQKLFHLWSQDEKCKEVFKKYKIQINTLNTKMLGYQKYLNVIYENIKQDIENDIKKGISYIRCSSCKHLASKEIKITPNIYSHKCRVCSYTDSTLRIKMKCIYENCNSILELTQFNPENGNLICENCGGEITIEEIRDTLDTDPVTKDNYFEKDPINCPCCGEMHCVIQNGDYYICTNCFTIEDSVQYCGWCGEGQLGGELENSYYNGCNFCEGRSGYDDDD